MDEWLAFAQGPFFRFAFAVMVLGLLRSVVITLWSVRRARQLADHKQVAWGRMAAETADWLLPVRHLKERSVHSVLSVLFHVGAIVTPFFLAAHVQLVERYVGVGWWTLPAGVADQLTLLTLVVAVVLLLARLASRAARSISRVQDFSLLALLLVPFASGYLAAHPIVNPFPYDPTMLVHLLSAGVCFLLVPFTKLSHMLLAPLARVPSELAWRFPPDYPEAVVRQIGREGQPI